MAPRKKKSMSTPASLSISLAWAFKKWIVVRPDGGCQVLLPLNELDNTIREGIDYAPKEKESK